MDEAADSTRRLAAWADGVLAHIDAQEELDRGLLAALGRIPSLREETLSRMAEAVRAAAMGLGPAGCAVAAGVSERLLLNWQAQDPSFAAAMAAASALARTHASCTGDRPPPLTPTALRVLLKAVRTGTAHTPAAALVGLSVRTLYRLRRQRPELEALVVAARRARPKKADRRARPPYEHRYRLVRVDDVPKG
ncbi:hypothetical protein [Streptomyces formicae]|uniref:Uncharacterized protein n=1 Tax=Streptomyces formicae TaxID=1616117 RepID=A0ABY3WLB3_9ACTN|nr:hypothetical protein [Streptomyces formicae]UNM13412.1 hypothetical protein J4032_19710 [Streptomyces formicae]